MINIKYKISIITLLLISIFFNSYLYIENNNFKEIKGDQVNKLSDIVLVLIPRDILEILNQEQNISDEDFERISGEFRVGIVFYWLSNGIPEIESYFRYMEANFLKFKKIYQESKDKNSQEIKNLKRELTDTCERGLELYKELGNYFYKHSENYRVISDDVMWYKAYKNNEHEIRKFIIEILGEERTTLY